MKRPAQQKSLFRSPQKRLSNITIMPDDLILGRLEKSIVRKAPAVLE